MQPISGRGCPGSSLLTWPGTWPHSTFALIGGGPQAREHGHQVLLKVVSRSNPDPVYRSDVTYFERLYTEALIDVSPEEVANAVRARF